jgi:polyhydroxyalkanoate synthesis regulator phasin
MASKRPAASSKRTGPSKRAAASSKRSGPSKRAASSKSDSTGSPTASGAERSDKSVQAFREALERSRTALESNVTLSRDRIEEVVDEAVERGRMTRGDANELIFNLLSRGREVSDDLITELEKLLDQLRKEVDSRAGSARRQATRTAERVGRSVRDAADRPLAEADKLRRRAGGPGGPITGYDQLTAAQIKGRLKDLDPDGLRAVRTQEKAGKARKGILAEIDRRLAK